MDGLEDIIEEFLVESHENLDQLDRDLVQLENEPNSRPLLASVFRTIHTIKGTSGFLALDRLERVTHVGESLLSLLRDGALPLTSDRTSALLELVDAVRAILRTLEQTGSEGAPDHTELIDRLQRLAQVDAAAASVPAAGAVDEAPAVAAEPVVARPVVTAPATGPVSSLPTRAVRKPAVEPASTPVPAPATPDAPALVGELLVHRSRADAETVTWAVREQEMGDQRLLGEILVGQGNVAAEHVAEAVESQGDGRRSVADATIRVDVDLLDSLMRVVGELVLTRNQILAASTSLGDPGLQRASQRLNLIASELQDGVMRTRMQPVDTIWNKLPRVVRDLSVQCGRQVRLVMDGRDTELDRTILEAIKDPLVHLVRNAIDHGIESPEARVAAGKPAEGVLHLRAFHEGGRVVVDIRDDGAGIDSARVAGKALERGLVTREQLARMSEHEINELIFRPGFSTAAAVTNVSGRGVGMDVVKTNIERIGGAVELDASPGQGTSCRLTIPLTLAIVPALTVACGSHRYAIPQVSLLEVVYVDAERARTAVEEVSGAPVYRLRGQLLPLVRLSDVLGVTDRSTGGTGGTGGANGGEPTGDAYVVVLKAEERRFGLVVDKVLDTEEIVVKALSSRLKGIGLYAGATILGDGAVALILDVQTLARTSHGSGDAVARAVAAAAALLEEETEPAEPMLVVGVGGGRRVAIPLETVTRLEEFPAESIEHVGGREVVQYRGRIVPLVRLSSLLGCAEVDPSLPVPVVVYSEAGRSVALAVESVVDIVEDLTGVRSDLEDHGLTGSVVIHDRVTELLDVRQAVLAADPHFYDLLGVG